jgi:hypothetical protein
MAIMVSMLTFGYVISKSITSFGIVGVLSDIFYFRDDFNNFRFFNRRDKDLLYPVFRTFTCHRYFISQDCTDETTC